MKAEHTKNIITEGSKLDQSNLEPSDFNSHLKIGYDGKRAANNLTGLGNYSRSLIESLSNCYPNNRYLVYTPKVKTHQQINSFFEKENIQLKLPRSGRLLWRSLNIVRDLLGDGVKLYHGLSHEIPLYIQHTPIRSVVTIHDLIFFRFPQYFKYIDRKIYEWKSKSACTRADKIIAISEKTKADIIEFYGIAPEKIEVIYQSCDESFKSPFPESRLSEIKSKYNLPEKYLLNVGTIESRKNLKLIVQSLKDIDQSYKLVVIGKQTDYFKEVSEEINKLGLKERIIFLNNIPFADLPAIYQLAKLFIYPSFYEGFGIPIIEALYSKIPVIAATGSCLEEAGGPNSLYVSPTNPDELSQAINQVLNQPALQEEMKTKGLEFVQKFNSPLVTQQLLNCYLNVLAKPI